MSATVQVAPVFANGATGDLKVTVTSDEFGDSLTGYVGAADVMRHAERALRQEPRRVAQMVAAAYDKGWADAMSQENVSEPTK